jgi:hypothetical protein
MLTKASRAVSSAFGLPSYSVICQFAPDQVSDMAVGQIYMADLRGLGAQRNAPLSESRHEVLYER